MIRHYLVTAFRNIARHRLRSFINICGLALGLTCVILIALFIRDETSFDKWVPDSANLYRLDETFVLPGRTDMSMSLSDFPLPALLKDNLPEVTTMTRFWPRPKTITIGSHAFAQDIAEVDSNFFQVIRFPLAAGDPTTVLDRQFHRAIPVAGPKILWRCQSHRQDGCRQHTELSRLFDILPERRCDPAGYGRDAGLTTQHSYTGRGDHAAYIACRRYHPGFQEILVWCQWL